MQITHEDPGKENASAPDCCLLQLAVSRAHVWLLLSLGQIQPLVICSVW